MTKQLWCDVEWQSHTYGAMWVNTAPSAHTKPSATGRVVLQIHVTYLKDMTEQHGDLKYKESHSQRADVEMIEEYYKPPPPTSILPQVKMSIFTIKTQIHTLYNDACISEPSHFSRAVIALLLLSTHASKY